MYITLNEKEFELFKELELSEKYFFSPVEPYYLTFDLSKDQLRSFVSDVLEFVPFLTDKREQKLICDLVRCIVVVKI